MNIFSARNIVRYHYGIQPNRGGEVVSECCIPFSLYFVMIILDVLSSPFTSLVTLLFVLYSVSLMLDAQKEVDVKSNNESSRYLFGTKVKFFVFLLNKNLFSSC
jgi:hypothetical protein